MIDEPESFEDQLSRLHLIASGDRDCDMSDNDLAALRAVLMTFNEKGHFYSFSATTVPSNIGPGNILVPPVGAGDCSCGYRLESPHTHPHVPWCPNDVTQPSRDSTGDSRMSYLPPADDLSLIFESDAVQEAIIGHCSRTHLDSGAMRKCSHCHALIVTLATAIIEWKVICDTEPK